VPDINDPQQDLKNYTVDMSEMKKVVKKYKKMKKYMKSTMYEINKLSGKKTFIDKLVGIETELRYLVIRILTLMLTSIL
jgi:hypothetical protein